MLFCTQVSKPGVAISAAGGTVLLPTLVVAEAVQPVLLFVTSKVYVPALPTVGSSVLPPLRICPPGLLVQL